MAHPVRQPLRFEPFFRPMIWGGRAIARFLGKNLPGTEAYGESWEVSDHPIHTSKLATASSYGATLRQLMESHRDDILGAAAGSFDRFPWLIKLLDARHWLSVQVHPDEEAVKKLLPGESAKTEAWYILDAAPESQILAGLKPGVGPKEFRHALDHGTLAECLHGFTPKQGDLVFVPAGTVHALGGGILLAEIQQTSDATFRLFDWNRLDATGRPRFLHIEQALAAIHWDRGPVEPISRNDTRQTLIACPYFEIARFQCRSTIRLGGQNRMQAWIVAEGSGRFANGEFFMAGDAWIFPAAMPAMSIYPDLPVAGLLCTLPE